MLRITLAVWKNIIFNPVGIKEYNLTPNERYIYMPKWKKFIQGALAMGAMLCSCVEFI